MKKSIISRLSLIIVATAFTIHSNSQEMAVTTNKSKSADLYSNEYEKESPVSLNDVDKRVLKAFRKSEGMIEGARWFRIDKGYGVNFKSNGMKSLIFYANNGAVDSRVNFYGEDKLPSSVYSLVKANFPDFQISHIAEVHKNLTTAHLINIQNKTTIKTLKVIADEWEVTETFTKN